jgi:hypothetical protein
MGGFYVVSFFYSRVAFVGWQWCRAIWLIFLSLSFFKNLPKFFFNFFIGHLVAFHSLGIHLKGHGV